jgi:hypothetical protein
MQRQTLAVFLRGERSYVQGTQIIARLAEQVAPEGSLLTQATFSQITANTVCWLPVRPEETDHLIGQVHFVKDDQEHVYWLRDAGVAAPRLDAPMDVQLHLVEAPAPLAGQYRFETPGDLEALLNVMVQAVKALHERLDPGVHDVWFTGMRQFALPVQGQPGPLSGVIDVRHRRLLRRGHQYQSLIEVMVGGHDGQARHQGVFNFAFKSEQTIHVD